MNSETANIFDNYQTGTMGYDEESDNDYDVDLGSIDFDSPEPDPEKLIDDHIDGYDIFNFPSEVISGMAGDFSAVFAEGMETPRHFFYMAYLAFLGMEISGKVRLNTRLNDQPRGFFLMLGESGTARKSTSIGMTKRFFEETLHVSDNQEVQLLEGLGSAEGFMEFTPKGSRVMLYFDEFASFVQKCRIQGATLLQCVTTLWGENSYQNMTKGRNIKLENVKLTMLAASTIDTLNNVWGPAFTSIGFNNRLFLIPGRPTKCVAIPPPIESKKMDMLKSDLKREMAVVGEGTTLHIADDAFKLYDNWYTQLRDKKSIHATRLDAYALRFMILITVNDRKNIVDIDTVRKVIRIMNWQLIVREQLDPIDADNGIAKLEEACRRVLRSAGKNGLLASQLKTKVNASRVGIQQFGWAIVNLLKDGDIRSENAGKKVRYFLNNEQNAQ